MSDITFLPTDISTLTQRLQSAEKSIIFIQREHASTLTNLHEEIAKWQQKCSDLAFQLAIGGTVINSTDDNKLRTTAGQLEDELYQCKEKIQALNNSIEEKEKVVHDYENRLIVNDRKHALELHRQYNKQRELKIELEQRATLIAQLTHQIHREKQHQSTVCNRIRLGQILLPNKPTRFKNNAEQPTQLPPTHRLSHRSSSLSNRISSDQELTNVLFIGRRPPTPPQQLQPLSPKSLELNDEQLYSKRQRQLLNNYPGNVDLNKVTSSQSANKLSTILPPIINRKIPLKALSTTTIQRQGEV